MARPRTKKPPSAEDVLVQASSKKGSATRAAYLESMFDVVDTPAKLVRPWFDASLGVPGNREATIERALATCHARSGDVELLDAMGAELARRAETDAGIDVLRMALAAGSTSEMTEMLLGYLLVRQDNAEGVPLLEKACERQPQWPLPRQALAGWLVSRDPARVLTLLVATTDKRELELCAMACEALGRLDEARRASAAAIEWYKDALDAHEQLCDWHSDNECHDRAFVHARALYGLRLAAGKGSLDKQRRDAIDETIVRAYSDVGQFAEVLPWMRRRKTQFPLRLGWRVYFALTAMHPNPDRALAIRAARDVASGYRGLGDASQARQWSIRAAGVAANDGDLAPLDALVGSGLDGDPDAWVEVAHRYIGLTHYDAASAAADRALVLDPECGGALVVQCQLALTLGDGQTLHRVAMALLAKKPRLHQGPEFLARSFARRLDATAAAMHSERARAMASFCHNAWTARAEALAIGGELDGARACVERSLRIRAGEHGDDALVISAALAGDGDRLESELAKRYEHLPALPFTEYVEQLRRIARR